MKLPLLAVASTLLSPSVGVAALDLHGSSQAMPIKAAAEGSFEAVATAMEAAQPPDPVAMVEAPWPTWALACLMSWFIWVLLGSLAACFCYSKGAKSPTWRGPVGGGTPEDIMAHGHFDVLRDSETCMWAFFCPAVRWADTVAMSGLTHGLRPFWPAFVAFVLLALLNCLIRGFLVLGPFTALGMLYSRQYIRKRLGMPFMSCGTCCTDCWFTLLCPFCAITQEARAVSQACAMGKLTGIPVRAAYAEGGLLPSQASVVLPPQGSGVLPPTAIPQSTA